MTLKEKRELIHELINVHKKEYKKKLVVVFQAVLKAIENGDAEHLNLSFEVNSVGYYLTAGDYSSYADIGNCKTCNYFDPKAYFGLVSNELLVCNTKEEMQKELNQRLEYLDKHLKLIRNMGRV